MISMIKKASFMACLLTVGLGSSAFAVAPDFMDKLQSDDRAAGDKVRDGSRRPVQVMELLGVEEGMTAIDIGAGGGWYTTVLSAAVGQSGKVISQSGPRALQRENGQGPKDLAESLGNTTVSFENVSDLSGSEADVAVTALNIHHSDLEAGTAYLEGIASVLKTGGIVAVIDHEGSEGMDNAALHRVTKSAVMAMAEAAGLELVEDSDLLHTNADDHSLPVFSPVFGRNTDRFLLVFKKS